MAHPPHRRTRGLANLRDVADSDTSAFAQVVVIGAGVVSLDVGTCCRRRTAIELHPAVHVGHPDSWPDGASATISNVQQLP